MKILYNTIGSLYNRSIITQYGIEYGMVGTFDNITPPQRNIPHNTFGFHYNMIDHNAKWYSIQYSHCKSRTGIKLLNHNRHLIAGGRFKNTYELLNLRALKISKLHKNHIFQCMGKLFCVEFQRVPLKFHTKYLTHTLKDVDFIHIWKFKSSLI